MKKSNDTNKLAQLFEHFDKSMQLKPQAQKQQKNRIITAVQNVNPMKPKNKLKISLVLIALFLIVSSPLYSTTAASLIEKIVPIKISNDKKSRLDVNIIKRIEQSGYDYDSVSITPNPFTVDIVLIPSNTSINEKKEVLMPEIREFLEKEKINNYKINISEYQKPKEIDDTLEKREINVKPNQNVQWPKVISNIHQALGGKTAYKVKGISYKTKEYVTYVEIKTDLENNQDSLLKVNAMERALKAYFLEDSTKKMIKNGKYEIRIYDNKKEVMKIIEKFE